MKNELIYKRKENQKRQANDEGRTKTYTRDGEKKNKRESDERKGAKKEKRIKDEKTRGSIMKMNKKTKLIVFQVPK